MYNQIMNHVSLNKNAGLDVMQSHSLCRTILANIPGDRDGDCYACMPNFQSSTMEALRA